MNSTNARRQLGESGEEMARRHLEARGLAFVTRNWRCRAGELDLVMQDDDVLVFVEVKTRRGEWGGRAEEAVSPSKARKMLAAGEWFVSDHPEYQELPWRCDLVAITIEANGTATIDYYVNAIVEA